MRYDLGTIQGRNRPIDISHDTHVYGWKLFTAFLIFANLGFIIFAVWGGR